eukprot:TRINITY_DN3319_c1_g1_i1.p1 TRINITY_DN3319_c1_g1~~TRINITY_DN3319_c1_g1_i1.p1  ORF type:complete len:890 (+),score=327.88 TRINITY_DN3319_c1_g1_i1:85-2670(+)
MASPEGGLLVGVDLAAGDGAVRAVALCAVRRSDGGVEGEKEFSAEGGVQAALAAAEEWANATAAGRRWTLAADGPSALQSTLRKAVGKAAVAGCWGKYYDVRKEVERAHGCKCSALVACLAVVDAPAVVPQPGAETARAVATVCGALLKKGHDFRRVVMARSKEEQPSSGAKPTKRQRPSAAEEQPAAPPPPPPPPSLRQMRRQLFGAAAELPPLRALADALSAAAAVPTPAGPLPFASAPGAEAGWLAACAGGAGALLGAGQRKGRPVLVVLPTAAMCVNALAAAGPAQAAAVFGDPALGAPPAFGAAARPSLLICTPARAPAAAAALPVALAPVLGIGVAAAGDDTAAVSEALRSTLPSGSGKAVVLTPAAGGAPAPLPAAPAAGAAGDFPCGEDGALGAPRPQRKGGSAGSGIDDAAVQRFAQGDAWGAAERLHALHQQHHPLDPTISALFYHRTAACSAPDASPDAPCPGLAALHSDLARLLAFAAAHVPEKERPSAQGLAHEVARAIRRLPLPPVWLPEAGAAARVEGDEAESARRKLRRTEPVPPHATCAAACLAAAAQSLQNTMIDALAELWGVRAIFGPRSPEVHTIKHGRKQGRLLGFIESALVKRLRNEQLGVPLARLEAELGWRRWFLALYGPFNKFLARSKAFVVDRGGRGSGGPDELLVSAVGEADKPISERALPTGGEGRDRKNETVRAAIDAVLAALPPRQVRTLCAAVGVRIGGWARFNQNHDGALGGSLTAFLMRYPEHFSMEGRTVWRTDPNSYKRVFSNAVQKWGGREEEGDSDSEGELGTKKRTGKSKGRRGRLHDQIAAKWERRKLRANKLRSLKKQKVPGFGKKKIKHTGKGTKPHWKK